METYISEKLEWDQECFTQFNASNSDIEIMWILVKNQHDRDIVVGSFHRPPRGRTETFIDCMENSITDVLQNTNREIFLMGDSNIDLMDKNNETKLFNDLLSHAGLRQLIKTPTRLGKFKNTCLDLIITNCNIIKASGQLEWGLSDHEVVFATRKRVKETKIKKIVTGRIYKGYKRTIFQANFYACNWDFIDSSEEVTNKWECFKAY